MVIFGRYRNAILSKDPKWKETPAPLCGINRTTQSAIPSARNSDHALLGTSPSPPGHSQLQVTNVLPQYIPFSQIDPGTMVIQQLSNRYPTALAAASKASPPDWVLVSYVPGAATRFRSPLVQQRVGVGCRSRCVHMPTQASSERLTPVRDEQQRPRRGDRRWD